MLAIVLWSLLFTSTGQADEYITDVQRWRQQRLKALTAEEGFLSLRGAILAERREKHLWRS